MPSPANPFQSFSKNFGNLLTGRSAQYSVAIHHPLRRPQQRFRRPHDITQRTRHRVRTQRRSTGVAVVAITPLDFSAPNSIVGLDAAGLITPNASADIYFSFVVLGTLNPGVPNAVSFQVGAEHAVVSGTSFQPYSPATTASIASRLKTPARTPAAMRSITCPSPIQ